MKKEEEILKSHISKHHLKATKERSAVLRAFMEAERHITAEDLYRFMKDAGSSLKGLTWSEIHLIICFNCDNEFQFSVSPNRRQA